MNKIALKIIPSEESNDHQVRIYIDGEDLIEGYNLAMLGLDPVDFFCTSRILPESKAEEFIFARCSCGVIGCGNATVTIEKSDDKIIWCNFLPNKTVNSELTFELLEYQKEIERAKEDYSWENNERRAERFVAGLNFSNLEQFGIKFIWASARLSNDKISLCLQLEDRGTYQLVVSNYWDHKDPKVATSIINNLILQNPTEWKDVICYPQENNLPKPRIFGAEWKTI